MHHGLLTAIALSSVAASAVGGDAPKRVLFVRGAERSGGFLEAGNDAQRTEQLADITNGSTASGNHGWLTFATTLRDAGFVVDQVAEPLETGAPGSGQTAGAPLDFGQLPLNAYDVVVLASNNAAYPSSIVDVFESYVRRGGAALIISDANFGGSWADAPTSDQAFLDRFGWTVQQDQGTYVLRRSEGDFVTPGHPILAGVDAIDGEGVSPLVVPETDTVDGVASTIVVRAKPGQQTRNNDRTPGPGTSRAVGQRDAVLAVATVDRGRIAGHFDRNTFFNANGAGTNINRFDNSAYAVNLFAWLADGPGLRCRVDYTGDGAVTAADVDAYLAMAIAGEPIADLAGAFGHVDAFDVLTFLRAFAQGCP